MMEELFVYALLISVGYEEYDAFQDALDRLFLKYPDDDMLLSLEVRNDKDAILYLLKRMDEISFDVNMFGKILMCQLKEIYTTQDFYTFTKYAYKLWQRLPDHIALENPFHILSYADDPLSWGDEIQCRNLYKEALSYYDKESLKGVEENKETSRK